MPKLNRGHIMAIVGLVLILGGTIAPYFSMEIPWGLLILGVVLTLVGLKISLK